MARKLHIDRPRVRTFECRHLAVVLLNEEERADLDKIMALRRCEEDDAIGIALRLSAPLVESMATAPTLPALPYTAP